jgi:hypothetical protein
MPAPSWDSILSTVGPERRAVLEEFKEEIEGMSPPVLREAILAVFETLPPEAKLQISWRATRKMAEDPATDMEDLRKAYVIAFKSRPKPN